ncbi:MAG: hypothetical protein AAF840_07950, partial [Bacteroidota bacterium]
MRTIEGKIKGSYPTKVDIVLSLAGMQEYGAYLIGDQVTGEVQVTARETINIKHISLRLEYLLKSPGRNSVLYRDAIVLESVTVLTKGIANTLHFSFPDTLQEISFSGKRLESLWRISVRVVYDKRKDIFTRLKEGNPLNVTPQPNRTEFVFPVTYGTGNYRVAKEALPISFISLWTLAPALFSVFMVVAFGLILRDKNIPTSGYYE